MAEHNRPINLGLGMGNEEEEALLKRERDMVILNSVNTPAYQNDLARHIVYQMMNANVHQMYEERIAKLEALTSTFDMRLNHINDRLMKTEDLFKDGKLESIINNKFGMEGRINRMDRGQRFRVSELARHDRDIDVLKQDVKVHDDTVEDAIDISTESRNYLKVIDDDMMRLRMDTDDLREDLRGLRTSRLHASHDHDNLVDRVASLESMGFRVTKR